MSSDSKPASAPVASSSSSSSKSKPRGGASRMVKKAYNTLKDQLEDLWIDVAVEAEMFMERENVRLNSKFFVCYSLADFKLTGMDRRLL